MAKELPQFSQDDFALIRAGLRMAFNAAIRAKGAEQNKGNQELADFHGKHAQKVKELLDRI